VCFVGQANALRPNRTSQILIYIREFEFAANIKFLSLGDCPASVATTGGIDHFDGDIRVVLPNTAIPGTGPIPGNGCTSFIVGGSYNGGNDGWGSWSGGPNDVEGNRSCLYNLKLGDDPWNTDPYLNHTLHEFGHALGLAHEHERSDVDHSICSQANFGGGATSGFLTDYDRLSVMHYAFPTCGIEGNYGRSGLSALDRLGLHILYPEDLQAAEFVGTTVIPSNRNLALSSAWQVRGAKIDFAAKDFLWKLSGTEISRQPSINEPVHAGSYTLEVSHRDFLERTYNYIGPVKVLEPSDYNRFVAGISASQLSLMQ
jgi:hypothetical protein